MTSRFIAVEGLANVRDIGGWPATTGSVKRGVVIRGSDLTPATERGMATLQQQVVAQFDLRSSQQIEKAGYIREIKGITRYWTPVFAEEDYTIERAGLRYQQYAGDGTTGIVEAFMEIVTHGGPAFKQIILHIASLQFSDHDANLNGVYISCTTGNNRTGPLVAILLSFLGVPDDVVACEYSLSEAGLAPIRASTVARLRSNSKFAASFKKEELEYRANRMVGARVESMEVFLRALSERWENAEGYLHDFLGLDEEVLGRLRAVLITPSQASAP